MVDAQAASASLALVNATLVTLAPLAARIDGDPRVSVDDLGIVRKATLVINDGVIDHAGPHPDAAAALKRGSRDVTIIDAQGRVVMPGLVDAHTHALFAGERVADFEALAAGTKQPLGMLHTIEQTRKLDVAELVNLGARRLASMLAHGTTTAEVKSGYALTAEGEVRMLRAMRELNAAAGLPHVVPTFCGAHALPPEFASYDGFTDELVNHILPVVAAEGIARFADAFCERGFFTPEQSQRFLTACAARGMRLRVHADELSLSGGAMLAAQVGCVCADHLNFVDAAGIAALRARDIAAVLCPATAEYLGLSRFAPARALIEAGVYVAIATDFNPGTCPCYSLQEAAHLARRRMRLTAAETVAGVTLFPARTLGPADAAGCLKKGGPADVVMLETTDFREFGYYFGVNLVKYAHVGRRAVLP